MKRLVCNSLLIFFLAIGNAGISLVKADPSKPQRPERIEEIKTDQPSEYHRWSSGSWKWNKKQDHWEWQTGYWRFDHHLYAFKNQWRTTNFYRPWRYIAIPVGRGYYRLVKY